MIRVELELSVPHVGQAEDFGYGTGTADSLGVAAAVAPALLEAMGKRGIVVHTVRVEEMDA